MALELSVCYDKLDHSLESNWLRDACSSSRKARQLRVQPPPRVRIFFLDTTSCGEQAPARGQRYEGKAQTCRGARFDARTARERREDRMTHKKFFERREAVAWRLSRRCRQRAGRRRERVSDMARALNSLHGVEDFPAATRSSPALDETRRILYRAAEAFSPPVSRDPRQEALRALLRTSAVYGDGSSTAPHRAELLALPDLSVQATLVQDLVRREDSECLVGSNDVELGARWSPWGVTAKRVK